MCDHDELPENVFDNPEDVEDPNASDGDDLDQDSELPEDDDCFPSEEENELPTLGDMYGYENDEDNEEAALDDVLKMQERGE